MSHLLLVLEVSNVQSSLRKPYAVNLLVVSDLTLAKFFKVKLRRVTIKVSLSCLLLVLEVSHLTLNHFFKVKLLPLNIEVHVTLAAPSNIKV